ncbi:MAG: cytochrome c maturation protein CcmE [Acidobacteria bacterium]|nr:cytochrome c maturation protein CcmE [Acidobacteriota bacterium]
MTLTAVVLVLAFAGMMWTTLREGTEYYKNVDEVLPQAHEWSGKQLQLHGYVVTSGGVVDATYNGIVPDTFKDEAEVVLKGKLTPTGFHTDPNGVMAKCPSKYEAQQKSASAGT